MSNHFRDVSGWAIKVERNWDFYTEEEPYPVVLTTSNPVLVFDNPRTLRLLAIELLKRAEDLEP